MKIANDPGDAVRDHTCLAATGACQDQQRAFRIGNGVALWGVESLEKIHAEFGGSYCYRNMVGHAFRQIST